MTVNNELGLLLFNPIHRTDIPCGTVEASVQETKKPRGRPVKNIIEPIDATPGETAKAIFRDADRKLEARKRIKFGK